MTSPPINISLRQQSDSLQANIYIMITINFYCLRSYDYYRQDNIKKKFTQSFWATSFSNIEILRIVIESFVFESLFDLDLNNNPEILIVMLDSNTFQKLMNILNSKEQTLDEIEGHFLTQFSQSISVFNASYVMSNLINLNLLTVHQRIITIFLLIQNFKSEGIKKHPFGATILNTSQKTTEQYQRRMIADLVIQNKRERYSKFKIQTLLEESQTLMDIFEERPEIKKLRDEFIVSLPKISQSLKSQVQNIVPDFNQKDKKYFSPEFEVSLNSIKVEQLSNQGFNVGFMRPLPQFLQISATQYNWLSPGIVSEVQWDNTAQIERKLVKVKGLIKKALDTHLNKDESTQVERVLQQQSYMVLYLDVSPQNLLNLIKVNPFVAASFLVKMSNYPLVSEYLDAIVDSQVSLNSIDVISRLSKATKLSNQFLEVYSLRIMKQCQNIPQNHKDRLKIARIIASFLRGLIKNKSVNLVKNEQEMEEFTNCFLQIEQVQTLKKMYKT